MEKCAEETTLKKFGIIDENSTHNSFAYISEENHEKWGAEISNDNGLKLKFHAIDKCMRFFKENNDNTQRELESTCDASLEFEGTILFIEIKMRCDLRDHKWKNKAANQISNTINIYKRKTVSNQNKIVGQICNSTRPLANTATPQLMKNFKDSTNGCKLIINPKIIIQSK